MLETRSDDTPLSALIAVPTFHRPTELARILRAIAVSTVAARTDFPLVQVDIVVIDNDPEGSARAIVESSPGSPRYVVEPRAGLAAVRNRALDEARDHRLLLFLDDDEEPTPAWFGAMVSAWLTFRPAGVLGRVVSVFEVERNAWLIAVRAFLRPARQTGDRLRAAATNNLLLDLHRIRPLGLRFEPTMGLSGGEDTLFTTSLTQAGETLVWADDAVVIDHIPADRMSRRWVLTRALRGGTVDAAVERHLASGRLGRARAAGISAAHGLVRIVGGSARVALGVVTRSLRHRARGERAVARGAGRFLGAFGYTYQEYARRANRSS